MGQTVIELIENSEGRQELWQWDLGRKVKVIPADGITVDEVHFGNVFSGEALVVEPKVDETTGDIVANVPNILITQFFRINVYAVMVIPDGKITTERIMLDVEAREKPSDYVYKETEIKNYDALKKRIEELEKNGGGSGKPGADGFSPIASVEQTADGAEITITDKNGTTKAIVKNGKDGLNGKDGADGKTAYQYAKDGGYTGTEEEFAQKMAKELPTKLSDLENDSSFVKNTDYASAAKAGVVKVNIAQGSGLELENGEKLRLVGAGQKTITERYGDAPITPANLDYAVRSGLISNRLEWTEQQKQSARDLIGASDSGVEITDGEPTKNGTVMTVNPNAEEVHLYTAEEIDAMKETWTTLYDVTLEEDVNSIFINADMNGNPFKAKKMRVTFLGTMTDTRLNMQFDSTTEKRMQNTYYYQIFKENTYLRAMLEIGEQLANGMCISKSYTTNDKMDMGYTLNAQHYTSLSTRYTSFLDRIRLSMQSEKYFTAGTRILVEGVLE